jgi:hypothetical protein
MDNDAQHLRMLAIGHYVAAAITGLFACIPLIHVTIGLFFLLNPPPPPPGGEAFPAQLFGLMFFLIGGAFVLGGWALAAAIFVAGRSLVARKRYVFCMVIACISCAFFPFGTVLGVFSLIVLLRPSVKALFDQPGMLAAAPVAVPTPGAWREEGALPKHDG